ncbi:MAG TPA: heme o synthase [Candidatus Limnocylindria bacterium]|nr:heme o synthase [Candidatus Limnocylindria bacterium]
MKAAAPVLTADALATEKGRVALFSELFKARLTLLVVLTTLVGFYLGSSVTVDYALMLHTVFGTALVASGAAALNQLIEREHDCRMRRTENRPLPSRRITPNSVLLLGVLLSVVGLAWLLFAVNALTAFLGAVTLASYLFVYTPLKRLTVLNTAVGAVPGALPPLMGWAAASGSVSPGGWALFALLFFWQLPHFMAIAWLYREDYARAGYRMLSGVDPEGRRTAASAVRNTIALLLISLFPYLLNLTGRTYLFGALLLGGAFLAGAVMFARKLTPRAARQLFFASIIYLPLLLGLLVADKTTKKLTPGGAVSTQSPPRAEPGANPVAAPATL